MIKKYLIILHTIKKLLFLLKYFTLGMIITFIVINSSSTINIWHFIYYFIIFIFPPNLQFKIDIPTKAYSIITIVSLCLLLFANNIFYYILGIIYFCVCKVRCLNSENDPNYILNLIFFNYGIFLITICFYPSNKLFIVFLILYNIIAALITESLWKKTRTVGYIK